MFEFPSDNGRRNDPAEQYLTPADTLPIADLCDEIIRQQGYDRSNDRSQRFDATWSADDEALRFRLIKVVATPFQNSYHLEVANQFVHEPHAWFSYRGDPAYVEPCDANWKRLRGRHPQKEMQAQFRDFLKTAPVEFDPRYSRAEIDRRIGELTCTMALGHEKVRPRVAKALAEPTRLNRWRASFALRTQAGLSKQQTKQSLQIAPYLGYPDTENN